MQGRLKYSTFLSNLENEQELVKSVRLLESSNESGPGEEKPTKTESKAKEVYEERYRLITSQQGRGSTDLSDQGLRDWQRLWDQGRSEHGEEALITVFPRDFPANTRLVTSVLNKLANITDLPHGNFQANIKTKKDLLEAKVHHWSRISGFGPIRSELVGLMVAAVHAEAAAKSKGDFQDREPKHMDNASISKTRGDIESFMGTLAEIGGEHSKRRASDWRRNWVIGTSIHGYESLYELFPKEFTRDPYLVNRVFNLLRSGWLEGDLVVGTKKALFKHYNDIKAQRWFRGTTQNYQILTLMYEAIKAEYNSGDGDSNNTQFYKR